MRLTTTTRSLRHNLHCNTNPRVFRCVGMASGNGAAAAAMVSPPTGETTEQGRGGGLGDLVFDPAAPPPFTLADIRAAIPKHCWVKDPWRSVGYVIRDVVVVACLAAGAAFLDNWLVWPLYWFAQGTMFWALFVLGHDWYRHTLFHLSKS